MSQTIVRYSVFVPSGHRIDQSFYVKKSFYSVLMDAIGRRVQCCVVAYIMDIDTGFFSGKKPYLVRRYPAQQRLGKLDRDSDRLVFKALMLSCF